MFILQKKKIKKPQQNTNMFYMKKRKCTSYVNMMQIWLILTKGLYVTPLCIYLCELRELFLTLLTIPQKEKQSVNG